MARLFRSTPPETSILPQARDPLPPFSGACIFQIHHNPSSIFRACKLS